MEHLNKIRLAAENQMRERARKQAEARVAELERGGRLNELPTPSKNGNNRRTSPNEATNGESAPRTPATAPASAMKTPSVGGTGGVETSPYATPAPDFASSAGSMEDVAVAVASLQSELEAMRRRQAAFNDELESRIDARSPAAVPHAAIDEAVTRRIQESVASIIAPYVEATIGRVREEMRAQILAETNANISASNEAAEETVERIGGLLGAAEAAARGAKEAAAAAEEAAVASEQRTERAEAHAAEAASCVADALDAKRSESVSPEMNARIAALEAALGDAERRAAAAEGEAREATATAKAAVRAAEQTARDVNATAKAAETQLETATQLARDEAREMERRAAEMEAMAAEAEARATEAERRAKEAEASAKEAREAAAAPAPPPPPPPPVDSVAAAPTPVPVPAPTSDPDTGAVAASVRADLAGEIASLKRAADEAVEVARQARAAQTELRAKCMDEVRSIRAAVKSLAPVVGAPGSTTAPPSPIKDGPNETEEAKEAITAKLRTELDALKRRVENLAGIASTSKSAEDAANEASKTAKSSLRAVENIEGEMKKLAIKADDAVASAASALAAAAAAAEDAAAAAESADAAEPKTDDGSSIALGVDEVAARADAIHAELKDLAVIVQTNAEGIAFLGQQAMLTAKKDDVEELRASVNKTAERAGKETDALKAATQASLEELEGRTKKLERGARRQSENREATPSAPARDGGETVSPRAVSALEKRMAALEASTAATPLSSEATDVAAGGDVKERVEKFESVASELTARVERLQEAVGVEMLAHMKRLDAKLKTVEQSLGEVKQQGTPTSAKQESGKPGRLDRANAARLASAEKAAADSRSTAEDAAEKAKLASEKAKAALAAVAEHASTTERVNEAEAKLRALAGEIEKFRADVAEMEVSSATNTADVVAIEGEWASARRHLKDLEQSVWKSMVMIREEAGLGTPSSDAGAATPATPTTAPAATGGTPLAATGRTPETPMSSFRALFSRGRRTSTAPRSTESESARRLRARRTESPERRDVARSEAVIEALDMGSPTRPARRSANRER